jgi:hypothetical protein
MVSSGTPTHGGYSHRWLFQALFAPPEDFFVSHSQIFVSLFINEFQNNPGLHDTGENHLQNVSLWASLDGRFPARTDTRKWEGT